MRFGIRTGIATTAVLVLAAFGLGRASTPPRDAVIGLFGVGGIIVQHGDDAVLWQYMPDTKKWMTIDEAFKRDQRDTHILPLPVKADKIRSMDSWGFLLTTNGEVWQYDLDQNKWNNVGMP
jgi:hypothetical protein